MSVLTPDEPTTSLPAGAWTAQVALGLIGTAATGAALSNALHSTMMGTAATLLLVGATALAFTAAYLEASELDSEVDR